ncbi:hypothetical protein JRO89_XS09G0194000 [Xanthoceras sorbifolium]|uniref:MATH domain-containing protein n=1 Tax=Xanthoceras sorbifolium TaxID=99658 RepID=A0ABQ8HLX3_9ROSI|nr:hypothetical protein JRO89_XS09G0194000 [Xanthoceras sorbifolium]
MATGAVLLKGRNAPPSHYLFKIKSFSQLSKSSVEKVCSDDFEAGGYKWKLRIYPTGDKSRNVKDNISIYLELVDTKSLPAGWEVNVISNFFIFNHQQNKYFSNTDVVQTRYHSMKTRFGIAKYIDLNTFSNLENGYLFDDTFDEKYESETFGCYKWNILLYPNGNAEGKGNSISIFLDVSRSSIPPDTNLFVKFLLRVKDQINGKHIEKNGNHLYAPSNDVANGFRNFLSLAKLKDPEEGYLVDDALIIEAEATLLGLLIFGETKINDIIDVKEMHYHSLNTMFGISKFNDLGTFSDPVNGYLSNDTYYYQYEPSNRYVDGSIKILSLAKLKDPKEGYLVDDTSIIEAEVTLLGLI